MDIAEKLEQIVKFKDDLNNIIVSKGREAKIKLTDIVDALNEIIEDGQMPEIDENQVIDKNGNIYDVNDDCVVYKDLERGIENPSLDCDTFLIYDCDHSYVRKIEKEGGLDIGYDGSGVVFGGGIAKGLDLESNNVVICDDSGLRLLNLKDGNKGVINELAYPDENLTRIIDMPNSGEMLVVFSRNSGYFQYKIVPFGTYVSEYWDSEDTEYRLYTEKMELGKTYKVTDTRLIEV